MVSPKAGFSPSGANVRSVNYAYSIIVTIGLTVFTSGTFSSWSTLTIVSGPFPSPSRTTNREGASYSFGDLSVAPFSLCSARVSFPMVVSRDPTYSMVFGSCFLASSFEWSTASSSLTCRGSFPLAFMFKEG